MAVASTRSRPISYNLFYLCNAPRGVLTHPSARVANVGTCTLSPERVPLRAYVGSTMCSLAGASTSYLASGQRWQHHAAPGWCQHPLPSEWPTLADVSTRSGPSSYNPFRLCNSPRGQLAIALARVANVGKQKTSSFQRRPPCRPTSLTHCIALSKLLI